MRKIQCSFFAICLLAHFMQLTLANTNNPSTRPPHYEHLLHLAESAIADCYEDEAETIKVEITDAGFELLLQGGRAAVPRNTKCLRYCIMRKNKLFNAEKMLDRMEMLNFFKIVHSTIEEELLKEVLNECSQAAAQESDRCERAHVAAMCLLVQLNSQGVMNI